MKGTKYEGAWVEERPKEELQERYEGWEDEVQHIINVSAHVRSSAHGHLLFDDFSVLRSRSVG